VDSLMMCLDFACWLIRCHQAYQGLRALCAWVAPQRRQRLAGPVWAEPSARSRAFDESKGKSAGVAGWDSPFMVSGQSTETDAARPWAAIDRFFVRARLKACYHHTLRRRL